MSIIRMGKQNSFSVVPYVVAWVDLLGYGAMLSECRYDPTSSEAKNAIKRLKLFNSISLKHTSTNFPIFQMNDGIASWRELSLRTKNVTQDFIARSADFFFDLQTEETKQGFPGPRMVIALGLRMKMEHNHRELSTARAKNLLQQINNNEISVEEAIYKACSYTNFCNSEPALQANFAFSKAYLAESDGKQYGFGGSNLFLDLSLFNTMDVSGLTLSAPIEWNHYPGLETNFAAVEKYTRNTFLSMSQTAIVSTKEYLMQVFDCDSFEEMIVRLQ